ncbi:MAG TPA: hypothetical protein VEI02_03110 [Planctomycetota bacterium]|nr:hypothetical protein [Planctomycetota bacterium]
MNDLRPTRRASAVGGLLVLLAATAPYAWTLRLAFQLDDYSVIPGAPYAAGLASNPPALDGAAPTTAAEAAPGALEAPVAESDRLSRAADSYLSRPVASLWWSTLLAIGGGRADPFLFRAGQLLWHAAAAWLLYRLLARLVGDAAAAAAAGWFALHPGAHQAITWIAAGGDLMSTALMLAAACAAIRGAERSGRVALAYDVAAALAFAAAVGAKETALAFAPAAVVAVVAAAPSVARRGLVRRVAFALAALGAVWVWRARLVGFGASYPVERPASLQILRGLPAQIGRLLAPWNQAPEFADAAPFSVRALQALGRGGPESVARASRLLAAACAAPVLASMLHGRSRTFLGVLVCAALVAVTLAPVTWLSSDDASFLTSRLGYAGMTVVAAATAFALEPAARGGLRRAALLLLPLVLLAADYNLHVARVELSAAAEVRRRVGEVEALAAPGGVTAVIDGDASIGAASAVGLIGAGWPWAASRVFHERPFVVRHLVRFDPDALEDLARGEPRVVRVLEKGADGRFVRRGADLPVAPSTVAFAPDPAAPGRYVADGRPPLRAVAAVRFPGEPSGGTRQATWELVDEAGAVRVEVGQADPLGETGEWIAVAPSGLELWAGRRVESVRFDGVRPTGALAVERALPSIRIVEAPGVLTVGETPTLAFRPPFPAPRYRVTFRFAHGGDSMKLVYESDAGRGDGGLSARPDGALSWRAVRSDAVSAEGPGLDALAWDALPKTWAVSAAVWGVKHLRVDYRVEGLFGAAVASRSPTPSFRLRGP